MSWFQSQKANRREQGIAVVLVLSLPVLWVWPIFGVCYGLCACSRFAYEHGGGGKLFRFWISAAMTFASVPILCVYLAQRNAGLFSGPWPLREQLPAFAMLFGVSLLTFLMSGGLTVLLLRHPRFARRADLWAGIVCTVVCVASMVAVLSG